MAGRNVPTLMARAERATRAKAGNYVNSLALSRWPVGLTPRGAFWAIRGVASEKRVEVILSAGEVGRTIRTPDAVNVPVELNVTHFPRLDLGRSRAIDSNSLARAPREAGSFLQTIYVLGVGTQKFPFLVQGLDETMCRGRGRAINRLLELGDESVKDGGRSRVAE